MLDKNPPFIRAMPKKGVFKDKHDYLDLIFRLLREDAIRPLREGINLIRSGEKNKMTQKEFKDLVR